MALKLKTFRIGSKPVPGAGIRLGVVRFLPRGVKKSDYQKLGLFDLWFPALAPSRQLFATRERNLFPRYRTEILKNSESRQTLLFLAEVAKKIAHLHRLLLRGREQVPPERAGRPAERSGGRQASGIRSESDSSRRLVIVV